MHVKFYSLPDLCQNGIPTVWSFVSHSHIIPCLICDRLITHMFELSIVFIFLGFFAATFERHLIHHPINFVNGAFNGTTSEGHINNIAVSLNVYQHFFYENAHQLSYI